MPRNYHLMRRIIQLLEELIYGLRTSDSEEQVRTSSSDILVNTNDTYIACSDCPKLERLQKIAEIRAESDYGSRTLEYLVDKGDRDDGLDIMSSFLKKSNKLEILDPYIFTENTSQEQINELIGLIELSGARHLSFFTSDKDNKYSKDVWNKVNAVLKKKGFDPKIKRIAGIHDRIWIKDRKSAVLMGTSFNGLGKSLGFILKLSFNDTQALLNALSERSTRR